VFDILESISLQTIKNENFLLIADKERKLVFATQSNLTHLCESHKLYLDGTFNYCTKFFLQLFTIRIIKNGHYIPLPFCLLPDVSPVKIGISIYNNSHRAKYWYRSLVDYYK
jgi:lipopolysaccharide biosynthesis glycosyltransferase